MIRTPISIKPKITKDDVSNGFIKRYFAKTASSPTIYEINNTQYNYYKTDPYFQTLELMWLISGNDENTTSTDGNIIYGVKHQNEKIVEYYNSKMPGLRRVLKNPLEFFNGTKIGS